MCGGKSVLAVGLVGAILGLGGCNSHSLKGDEGGRTISEVCARDELASNAVLYFGPSNQIGPGSVWSRLGPNGGYQPQWRIEDLKLNVSEVVQLGKAFSCDFSRNAKLTAEGGSSILSLAANVSAEIKADFDRAKTIKVLASEAAWDTVIAGPYQAQLDRIANPDIKRDVVGENRLVLRRALRLSGYKALLEFDMESASRIKMKYDGVSLGTEKIGEVGAQLTAKWTKGEKLELSAVGNVYVAGEFAELKNGEFRSTKGETTIQDLGDRWIKPYTRFGQ